jgi:hypothetical protein
LVASKPCEVLKNLFLEGLVFIEGVDGLAFTLDLSLLSMKMTSID